MSAFADGAVPLGRTQGVPPRKQRVLAPSAVQVIESNMNSSVCVCSLMITDPVNLAIYYVPMTIQMVEQLRDSLEDIGAAYHNAKDRKDHAA
jgi:hypothetical protein